MIYTICFPFICLYLLFHRDVFQKEFSQHAARLRIPKIGVKRKKRNLFLYPDAFALLRAANLATRVFEYKKCHCFAFPLSNFISSFNIYSCKAI